jgi:glycosyltransferase involved in cell wall biosynthesis
VVQFLGHRADVPQILAAADVGVLSSAWEGNPLCVMEMMASGIPVIGTAVGGVPELITDRSGIVVPPGDVQAFSDAIVKMTRDAEGRKQMGAEAVQVAQQHFGTDKMVRRYEELYSSRVEMLHRTPIQSPAVGD